MVYTLATPELIKYLHERASHADYRRVLKSRISEDGECMLLEGGKNAISVKPAVKTREGISIIEFEIHPETPGVNNSDVKSFLESLIEGDRIFQRGNPLYSQEREVNIAKWRAVLRRTPARRARNPKMSCLVIDRRIGAEFLRKAIYEYMFRPCLYYLFKAGSFG